MLARIQNDLFDVEADLCLARKAKGPGGERDVDRRHAGRAARGEIDALNDGLAPLQSFVLPGGSPAAAYLHLARTICRRAERVMVELSDMPARASPPALIKYVNRLSDFLFVASRHANDEGAQDVLWAPGQNR